MPPSPPSTVTKSTPRCAVGHLLGKLVPEPQFSDRRLDADRQAGSVRDLLDDSRACSSMSRNAVCRDGARRSPYPAGCPGSRAISALILAPGRSPPRPGLAPWLSLTRSRARAPERTRSTNRVEIEVAPLVAAAEVAGADLEDEIAALAVVVGEAALAGVVQQVGELGAAVERLDRAGGRASRSDIAETLTTDAGRKACLRPRGPPRTFARRATRCRAVDRRGGHDTGEGGAA